MAIGSTRRIPSPIKCLSWSLEVKERKTILMKKRKRVGKVVDMT